MSASKNPSSTPYTAARLTYDSVADFNQTRASLDERLPLLEPSLTVELVLSGAWWTEVETVVERTGGPTGLLALSRLDSGALLSLSRRPLDATLCLVGNPVMAREVTALEPAAALYAPVRVAIYQDANWVHVAYDQPSSVFKSLASPAVDRMAVELDEKIGVAVEDACR